MKIYVHPIESASGAKELYDTVSKTVDKLFGKISKVLNKVASWCDVKDPQTLVGSKVMFNVYAESASNEDEEDEEEFVFKFVWDIVGASEAGRYCVCDFYLKEDGAPDDKAVSDTGVLIDFRDVDNEQTVDEYLNEYLFKKLENIIHSLLSKYTNGEIDSYYSIEVAQS